MQNLMNKTVREIALELPVTTKIFEEFRIDYCCGGHQTFLEACQSVSISPEMVLDKIENAVGRNETRDFDWLKETTLSNLIKYILEKHHTFTRNEIARLTPLMTKVVNRHGEFHPELFELDKVFQELCADLLPHLVKEEQILFPYIEKLENSSSTEAPKPLPLFGSVQNPIRRIMTEHDTAGELLEKMRDLTHHYLLPDEACSSYQALYQGLEAFELDLHQHVHLENNLLFPKAIELEDKVLLKIGQGI